MDWFAPIDIYCERTAVGFWNEPLNAISNAAFILAAIWGYAVMRRNALHSAPILIAVVLVFLIGVGSFSFHTFANGWSELADVIPIWTFVATYLLISIHYFGGVSFGKIGVGVAIVVGMIAVTYWVLAGGPSTNLTPEAASEPDPLNGSGQYAPAVIAFIVVTVLAYMRKVDVRHWLGGAGLVFLLSLTARTVDRDICEMLPIGTHYIWHMLNGLTIALLLQAIIRHVVNKRVVM